MAKKTDVIELAQSLIGMSETNGNNSVSIMSEQIDEQIYGMSITGLPWCDYFVDYIFCKAYGVTLGCNMLYQTVGAASAACAQSAQYFKNNNAFYTSNPEIGDQVFFYSGGGINHTGIVETVSADRITTIEGNYSDKVSRVTHYLSETTIAGYGRPKWSLIGDNSTAQTAQNAVVDTTPTWLKTDSSKAVNSGVTYPIQKMAAQLPLIKPIHANQEIDAVQALCVLLIYHCCYSGATVTKYNTELQTAVAKFQTANGLVADKEVGAQTWLKLLMV